MALHRILFVKSIYLGENERILFTTVDQSVDHRESTAPQQKNYHHACNEDDKQQNYSPNRNTLAVYSLTVSTRQSKYPNPRGGTGQIG
jgi:hypothetical protein